MLRLNLQFPLAVPRQNIPIKDLAVSECHLAALRKATQASDWWETEDDSCTQGLGTHRADREQAV